MRRAVEVLERSVRDNGGDAGHRSSLANFEIGVGRLELATGRSSEALAAFERSRKISNRLAKSNPTATEHQSDLGTAHLGLARSLLVAGLTGEVSEHLRQA
jgi:hypothetical protein